MSSLGNCQYLEKKIWRRCTRGRYGELEAECWEKSWRVSCQPFEVGVKGIFSIFFLMHFMLNSECMERKDGGCVREWPVVLESLTLDLKEVYGGRLNSVGRGLLNGGSFSPKRVSN